MRGSWARRLGNCCGSFEREEGCEVVFICLFVCLLVGGTYLMFLILMLMGPTTVIDRDAKKVFHLPAYCFLLFTTYVHTTHQESRPSLRAFV